ncbi:MAG: radical SAM protein [Candidatus Heimdallarchaeota archaeon]
MFPKDIRLQITPRCNQYCKHCFAASTSEVKSRVLTDEEVLWVVDQIAREGLQALSITGGEPLLRKELVFKILSKFQGRSTVITLNTNGWFLNEQLARQLKQLGLNIAQISLDSVNSEKHDTFRGAKGSYDRAVQAIENCVNVGLKTHVRVTITSFNFDEMPELFKLVMNKNVHRLVVKPLIPSGRGGITSEKPNYEQHRKAIADLINQLEIHPNVPREYIQFLSPCFPFLINEEYTEYTEKCECGEGLAFITANGDVKPCGYTHMILGNLRGTPLEKLWTETPFLLKWRRTRLNEKCLTCEYAEICQGGCRAAAYETTGTLIHPDPLCWLEASK